MCVYEIPLFYEIWCSCATGAVKFDIEIFVWQGKRSFASLFSPSLINDRLLRWQRSFRV